MLENTSSLVLLLLLLPVIILYMLKPKPRALRMPSLMLLFSREKNKNLRTLFKKLIRDPLLFIQLAAITILVFSLVNPYLTLNTGYESTIIVLDNSASMSSTDVSPSRFSQAVDIASGYIAGGRSSLILAGSSPRLLFKDAGSKNAIMALRAQSPGSTGTDLSEAMLLASELTGGSETKIAVISDFSGQDITFAKKILEAKNISVDYRHVGGTGRNVGIIDASISSDSIRFAVRNYDAAARDITVRHDYELQNRTIKPGSTEFFDIVPHQGKNTIFLEPLDDLTTDDYLYVSIPSEINKRVLLLSDKVEKSPLSISFNSIPRVLVDEVSYIRAPRRPGHNIVILYNYTKDSLLPGTLDDLRTYVEEGGMLVIQAEDDLAFMDTKGLLPVEVSGRANPSGFEVTGTDLTVGLDIGVSAYLKATLKEGAVALVSAPEGPVLAYWNMGRGKVVYLGMNEKWGDFHLRASYPIFWYRLLGWTSQAADELNYKTGTILPLGTIKTVAAPHETIMTSDLYLGDSGFYEFSDRTIAANLLDEKESDITVQKIGNEEPGKSYGIKVEKMHFDVLFAILAIILVCLELYYLSYRGDI